MTAFVTGDSLAKAIHKFCEESLNMKSVSHNTGVWKIFLGQCAIDRTTSLFPALKTLA
jgi:hypothetical protein